jgi:hypothetical protein
MREYFKWLFSRFGALEKVIIFLYNRRWFFFFVFPKSSMNSFFFHLLINILSKNKADIFVSILLLLEILRHWRFKYHILKLWHVLCSSILKKYMFSKLSECVFTSGNNISDSSKPASVIFVSLNHGHLLICHVDYTSFAPKWWPGTTNSNAKSMSLSLSHTHTQLLTWYLGWENNCHHYCLQSHLCHCDDMDPHLVSNLLWQEGRYVYVSYVRMYLNLLYIFFRLSEMSPILLPGTSLERLGPSPSTQQLVASERYLVWVTAD